MPVHTPPFEDSTITAARAGASAPPTTAGAGPGGARPSADPSARPTRRAAPDGRWETATGTAFSNRKRGRTMVPIRVAESGVEPVGVAELRLYLRLDPEDA